VLLFVGVSVIVGVNVKVAVNRLGVAVRPPLGTISGVTVTDTVSVIAGVGVSVGFSGVSVQAIQPIQ